jgi:hypothetical protein
LLLAGLSLAVAPQVAAAADTVIGFDDQASGTVITNQYAALGVTFDRAPSGPTSYMPTVQADAANAHSSPNVLTVAHGCGGEFPQVEMWAAFAAPRNHVSTYVGNLPGGLGGAVTMQGYDLGGNPITAAKDTVSFPNTGGVNSFVSIMDPLSQISYVELTSTIPTYCPVAIDDFTFDAVPATISPDFGLSAKSSTVNLPPGGSFDQTLTLHRTSTSTGPITLSLSGLPGNVTTTLNPNPVTGPDGSTISLKLTVPADSPAESAKVTVTGTPSSSAGSQPRSTSFALNVAGPIELRAQGLDITQGIVNDNYLLVPSGGASGLAYRGMAFSPPDSSQDPLPSDSPLVEGNPTVVRFYADASGAAGPGLFGVGAELHGYRHGHPLPGSPIMAYYGPSFLSDTGEADPAPVLLPERISDRNAFTFRLPSSWTSGPGPITLTGSLIAPTVLGFTSATLCRTTACQARANFTMTGVTFVHLPTMRVAPVQIIQPSEPKLPSPQSVYARALLSEPNAAGYTIEPYVATLDPTDVIKNPNKYDPKGDMNNGYLQLLENWGQQYTQNASPRPDLVSGVNIDQRGVTPCCQSTYDYPAVGFDLVYANRPLSSVAHELGHDLGRNHADDSQATGIKDGSGSSGCNGNGGPWPPDGLGYMQGIGLDMSTYPFRILYPGLPGEPSHWFDKMSYCAQISCPTGDPGTLKPCSEPDSWISPYGWLHSISALWLYGQKVGRARDALAAQSQSSTRAPATNLVVSGVLDSAGGRITSVVPTTITMRQPATSSLKLVSLDRSGHTLASTNLFPRLTHDDPGPSYFDFMATVPASGVNSLEVTDNGVVVVRRARPPHFPRVRVLAPARHSVVGGRHPVRVSWRASEVGAGDLTITVEYSSDRGRHWRPIYLGPNRGHTRLPSFYFAASRDARVRVVASDGFNQTAAVSARFTALASPPQVLITSPNRGFRIAGDANLQLAGEGFDQRLRRLSGRQLHWLDGPFSLGHGATLSAEPLPPGRNMIRLVGRDAAGGQASATQTVLVTKVKLPFLHLRIPARTGARARRLILTASASHPATLSINGHRFQLTRKSKRLRLAIRPGRLALLLELAVSDHGVRIPFAAKVAR